MAPPWCWGLSSTADCLEPLPPPRKFLVSQRESSRIARMILTILLPFDSLPQRRTVRKKYKTQASMRFSSLFCLESRMDAGVCLLWGGSANRHPRRAGIDLADHGRVRKSFRAGNCQHFVDARPVAGHQQAAAGLRIGQQVAMFVAVFRVDAHIVAVTRPVAPRGAGDKTLARQIEHAVDQWQLVEADGRSRFRNAADVHQAYQP